MGQAAGTAAALAIKSNVVPRRLDTGLLRKQLINQGIPLDKKPALYVRGFPYEKPLPEKPKFEIEPSDALIVKEDKNYD